MITKKEDLIGRYALRSEKEVFELFMQKCEELEMTWCSGEKPRDITDGDAVDCNYRYGGLAYGSETYYADRGFVKLTISDFKPSKEESAIKTLEMLGYVYHGAELWEPPVKKPRTRTEYVKVTESIFDLREEFERGELYHKFEHAREYSKVKNTESLSQALNNGCCYRKVEKEIDERQEFIDELGKIQRRIGDCQLYDFYNAVFESGKFKLIG